MKEMSTDDVKSCSLDILDFINQVCTENNLTYYLSGGTLLGAVRHKGFIPWDDDIDIMMPRKDYDRLFEIWPKESYYKALNHKNTHNFPYAFGKVIDRRTIKIEPIRESCQVIGVDVDIFPIDNLPETDREIKRFFKDIESFQDLLNLHIEPYGRSGGIFRTVAHNILIFLRRILEVPCNKTIDEIVAAFSSCAQSYNGQESMYQGIAAISHYGDKEINPTSSYAKTVNVIFEGRECPAPIGYEMYLTRLYGNDYMQLPPAEMRQTHHSFKAFWK